MKLPTDLHFANQSIPGATMYQLRCGKSTIKILEPNRSLAPAPPGGIQGSTGYRYWTLSVSNLAELLTTCEAAGSRIAVPATELRPGMTIAMVEDPDGNWVEFLQADAG